MSSIARKRRARSAASDSIIFSLFRRNPKQRIVWEDADKNTKTTKIIRPNTEGNVLKLGLFNGEDIPDSVFVTGHKITHFQSGNIQSPIDEYGDVHSNSGFGENLSFSVCFKKDLTTLQTNPISANTDLTSLVDIVIHNPGHYYQVGEHIDLSASNFIKKKGVLKHNNNTNYGTRLTTPNKEKRMYLKVLQTNKIFVPLGHRDNNLVLQYSDNRLTKIVNKAYTILDDLLVSIPSKRVIYINLLNINYFDSGVVGNAGGFIGGDKFNGIRLNDDYYTDASANQMSYLNDIPVLFNTNILIHEILHILGFNYLMIPLSTRTNNQYNGPSKAVDGYKQLLNANYDSILSTAPGEPGASILLENPVPDDFNHITVVPLEDDGGPGTKWSHWEDDLSGSDPRTFSGRRHPILKNEIMTGFVSSGLYPGYEYLTTMTTGLLKDLNFTINDNSKWVTTTGTKMSWE